MLALFWGGVYYTGAGCIAADWLAGVHHVPLCAYIVNLRRSLEFAHPGHCPRCARAGGGELVGQWDSGKMPGGGLA